MSNNRYNNQRFHRPSQNRNNYKQANNDNNQQDVKNNNGYKQNIKNNRTDGNNNYQQNVKNNNGYQQNIKNNNSYKQNTQNRDSLDFTSRKLLINYIYDTIALSNYKYKLIEFEHDLPLLKEKNCFVSPNYNGVHSLLIFIKINDRYISVIVDRKTLSYNINQVNYDKVKIIPVSIRLDEEVYRGTIIDGVMLYNNVDNIKNFVVNDVYSLRGNDVSADKITNKMLNFGTYLDTVKQDSNLENLVLIINKLYQLKDIQQLINVYIPKSKYLKSIKGVTFYPEYSGTKLIYLYNNCAHGELSDKKVNDTNDINSINSINGEKDISIGKVKDNVTLAVFKMKKTDIVDVYNLYLGEKFQEDGKMLFKYKKICMAYIPTKECSYFCKEAFSKNNTDNLLVKCKYEKDKERWIPTEIMCDRKRSDLVSDVFS